MRHTFFTGIIAPAFTAFNKDGSLNLDPVPAYAGFLKNAGVNGVFICGSSGEGLLMTTEERKAVTEAWIPCCDDHFRLIVHVGSTSYETSRELAAHAGSLGAHATSCIGPCFFQPKTIHDLVRFCVRVASAATDTPFYYYHMPALSGVNVKMAGFLAEAATAIPNLAGIKFTSPDLMDMFECLTMEDGRYDILHGQDQTLICGLSLGAKGAIGTTFNFMAPLFNELMSNFSKGEIEKARDNQKTANKILSLLHATGGSIQGGKAILKIKGIDLGPCREPLPALSDSQYKKLRMDLEELNFFKL